MNFAKDDLIIYHNQGGYDVYTFINAVDNEKQEYKLDFQDAIVKESEVSGHHTPNLSIPDKTTPEIADYHECIMIDRIIRILNSSLREKNLKIYKSLDTIRFESVVQHPAFWENEDLFNNEIARLNKVISKLQKVVKSAYGSEIPCELFVPLKTVSLNSITI